MAEWAISVNGVPIGLAAGSATSVEVTDVDRTQDVTFGVAGLTADKLVGETTTVVLPAETAEPAVTLDIKPGSAENPINLRSRGVIPVALLSTPTFDATKVDFRILCFGDAEAAAERDCSESHGRGHFEDADGDGLRDLVLHYNTQQAGIDRGDTRACVNGRLPSGTTFEACDVVRTR